MKSQYLDFLQFLNSGFWRIQGAQNANYQRCESTGIDKETTNCDCELLATTSIADVSS